MTERRLIEIGEALVACGCMSLDDQARALGLHRSTAWTVVKSKHKLDRLQRRTIKRMLDCPDMPDPVRAVVVEIAKQQVTRCR
jgi:hypothetical protein